MNTLVSIIAGITFTLSPAQNPADCTLDHPCLNGNVPSYSNPSCWPGAIYCPPAGTAADDTISPVVKS